MPRPISKFLALILTSCSLLLACGGGAANGPKSLTWHYDEVHIAQFSLEEKATVLTAQNEFQRARAEQMKVESDLDESKTTLQVAKNEGKQAKIAEQSAAQEKSAADASGDMNRSNRAAHDQRVAELQRRAADAKVKYIKAQRKYLGKVLKYRREETYHKEARYEYQKAQLGQSKNIAPKGVNYANYKAQVDERSRRAQKAQLASEQEKKRFSDAKSNWERQVKEAEKAKGGSGSKSSVSEEN